MEIALCNVSKMYDPGLFRKKVQAIDDLSLEVRRGEVFGLIGPNGAGKSTTIRLILGLIRPDSGGVYFRGKPLRDGLIQKEIGYLPENPYLYDHLTLDELLTFSARVSGLSRIFAAEKRTELLEKLDLANVSRRPLRTYSKGMLQRAGICFALLHDPEVVIFDEPMSGLDPIGRKMVFDLVLELKEKGKTIFFCSHILSDVERLCDRIGLMKSGKLVQSFLHSDLCHEGSNSIVNLVTDKISGTEKEGLAIFSLGIIDVIDGCIISVPGNKLRILTEELERMRIEIRSSKTDRLTLEERFMQVMIKEN